MLLYLVQLVSVVERRARNTMPGSKLQCRHGLAWMRKDNPRRINAQIQYKLHLSP